jgi:hypothetical protein
VVHFEKYLKACKAIGDDEGAAMSKFNIAYAKSKYDGGSNNEEVLKASLGNIALAKSKYEGSNNNNEEMLKTSRELYELRVAKHGEGSELAIDSGRIYAVNLQKANRGDEARELLTKLLVTSKQVLGSDHRTSKEVASILMC